MANSTVPAQIGAITSDNGTPLTSRNLEFQFGTSPSSLQNWSELAAAADEVVASSTSAADFTLKLSADTTPIKPLKTFTSAGVSELITAHANSVLNNPTGAVKHLSAYLEPHLHDVLEARCLAIPGYPEGNQHWKKLANSALARLLVDFVGPMESIDRKVKLLPAVPADANGGITSNALMTWYANVAAKIAPNGELTGLIE